MSSLHRNSGQRRGRTAAAVATGICNSANCIHPAFRLQRAATKSSLASSAPGAGSLRRPSPAHSGILNRASFSIVRRSLHESRFLRRARRGEVTDGGRGRPHSVRPSVRPAGVACPVTPLIAKRPSAVHRNRESARLTDRPKKVFKSRY